MKRASTFDVLVVKAHGESIRNRSDIHAKEEGSNCEPALTRLAAVNTAISRPGYAIVATGMQHCLAEGGGPDEVDAKKMEKFFLALV